MAHEIQESNEQPIIEQIIADAIEIALYKERNIIARELHDHVNQQLALAIMYIAAAEKKPQEKDDLLKQSVQLITQSINEIRKISHHLIVEKKTEFSLVHSLNALITDLSSVHALQISFNHINFNEELVTYEIQLHIFRILQELISNVLKHADATQINIQLSLVQQQINLLFEDNGIGFDVSSKINGIGLMNINARVKNINGTISIEGGLKKGTKITINSTL
jgi:signal transduction histidine kinase